MEQNYTEAQVEQIIVLAGEYGVSTDRIRDILNDIYEANFDEDLETVEEHLIEVEGN